MDGWAHDDEFHAWWVEPGAVMAGEYPTDWKASSRKLDLLLDAGIRTFVDLTTRRDPLRKYESVLAKAAERRGIEAKRMSFPIPDMSVLEVDGYTPIVDAIAAEIHAGRPVYVHCWGGIGRTGTVIGCWLVRQGRSADEAVAEIARLRAGTRKAHRHAPETNEQAQMIKTWAALETERGDSHG